MADESELRRMLEREAAGAPAPELDPARLVRSTRARRLPRQLAVGSVATLAVVGLGVGTATGVRLLNPPASMSSAESGAAPDAPGEDAGTLSAPESESDSSAGGAAGGSIELAPAYKLNFCGGMLATPPPDDLTGVSVELDFPDTADTTGTVHGSVRITNDTGARLTGTMSDIAATTLSDDGVVLWHTPSMERTAEVDLAPGASAELDASFEPRVCGAEDDSGQTFRPDLPLVEPGDYDVSVALDIEREDGLVLQLVSDSEPITLR